MSEKMSEKDRKAMEEFRKVMQEQQKKQQEIGKAFEKVAKPYLEKQKGLIDAIQKCSDCKKEQYRIDICKKHLAEIREIAERIAEIQLGFQLKMKLDEASKPHKCSACGICPH